MITILLYHLIVLAQLYLVCRNKTVSIKEMVQVFLVGATAVVFGNFLVQGIAVRIWGSDIVYYTFGPIAEEVIKVALVVFLPLLFPGDDLAGIVARRDMLSPLANILVDSTEVDLHGFLASQLLASLV